MQRLTAAIDVLWLCSASSGVQASGHAALPGVASVIAPLLVLAAAAGGLLGAGVVVWVTRRHARLAREDAPEASEADALAAEIHRRRVLMDQSNDGIAIINQEHRLVEVNRKFAEMLGYGPDEMVGLYTWDYEATMTEADIRLRFGDLQQTKAMFETQHRRKDGFLLDVEVSASGTVVQGEKLVLAIIRDSTERKHREQALQEAKEAAEAASRVKSQFLANMSHEFRTPLNGVMGMLQLLQGSPLSREQHEQVDVALHSCKRLTRLLSDVLDMTYVEAGTLQIHHAPLSLQEELMRLQDLFMPVARQKGIAFRVTLAEDIPQVLLGDGVRLQQVLTSIAGNALKFTQAGQVTVEAYPLPPRSTGECRVLFSVTDTGIGIPDDMLPQLFLPFTQGSSGLTRAYQGAGLGLAMCKYLVQRMGGNIAVESEPRVGTTVYFCITFGIPEDIASPS
ncbi:PAS domain-containing sensor histidine kinase [Megalodesulfovibrio paquesii]